MKASCLFAVLTLSLVVNGAWWTAAIQPILLSFGAAFAALNLDVQPLLDIDWKGKGIFKQDKEEQDKEEQPQQQPQLAKEEFIHELQKLKKKTAGTESDEKVEKMESVRLPDTVESAKFLVDLQQKIIMAQ